MMIVIACLILFLSVLLGAFGAHGLEHILDEKSLAWWHTATQYMEMHGLALLLLGLWGEQKTGRKTKLSFWGFLLGIFLFSGSLYALALTKIRTIAMITPLGGLLLMLAWLCFAYSAWKDLRNNQQPNTH